MGTLGVADVPFPPSSDPAGVVQATRGLSSKEEVRAATKKALRRALLRWHPDKWQAVLQKVHPEEQVAIGELLAAITQAIVQQKDRCR